MKMTLFVLFVSSFGLSCLSSSAASRFFYRFIATCYILEAITERCLRIVGPPVPLLMQQVLNLSMMLAPGNDVLDMVHVFASNCIYNVLGCLQVAIGVAMTG